METGAEEPERGVQERPPRGQHAAIDRPPHHRGAHHPDMVGQWARFWAPAGRTETARYWFRPDGTFIYHHPAGADAGKVRRGHYQIRHGELALTIEQEQLAGGPPQAIRAEEVLPLGHCPPNEEAEALDHSYACVSLAGQAYFRCPSTAALPESAFEL